jgi:hypothetical protein
MHRVYIKVAYPVELAIVKRISDKFL